MPTAIEWCDETFNPWHGCTKVSPACAHCYAEPQAMRFAGGLKLWGEGHEFKFFDDKHWAEPLKWARNLPAKLGRRPRVFCASMADVFEARPEVGQARERLFALIAATPELDWLVLTKRPEYTRGVLGHPQFWFHVNVELLRICVPVLPGDSGEWARGDRVLPNLWLGVSIENARYTWRADVLREIPAAVRFISAEPLLGSLYPTSLPDRPDPLLVSDPADADDMRRRLDAGPGRNRAPLDLNGIDWIIIGGESGPGARPFHLEHARTIIQAATVESLERTNYAEDDAVAVFVKQLGAKPISGSVPGGSYGIRVDDHGTTYSVLLNDRKGGDMDEWPADLRIREFPRSAVAA